MRPQILCRWCALLSALKAAGIARIGLLLHWYSESLENETIVISQQTTLTLGASLGQTLYRLGEDQLYWIE